MNNKVNSLSIIDNTDMDSFKNTMGKIQQFQRLVRENLIEGKDYGTIPGTSKPTLYKAGAEKIVILGKLRSTFDVLNETKDYDKEFFDFEIRWNLWAGDNLLVQGVGLCNSKEDKYRYRWFTEKKLPSNVDKSKLVSRNKTGKYGDYKEYRMTNEDVCTLANTILKMAKKRALVDAALLVGSLSDLFTQDIEDLPREYLNNKDNDLRNDPMVKEKVEPALKKHINKPEPKLEKKAELNPASLEEVTTLLKEVDIQNWAQALFYARKANLKVSTETELKKLLTEDKEKINRIIDARGVDKPVGTIEKHFQKLNEPLEVIDEDLDLS